jgi:prepilin-type processing-associated H-X9-DG protein
MPLLPPVAQDFSFLIEFSIIRSGASVHIANISHGETVMRRAAFTLIDLLAGLAMLVVVVLCSLAATVNLDNARTRVKCASNLRQIGQALMLYSNDNRGPYSRTKYDRNTADQPTAYTGVNGTDPFAQDCPQRNDVSAAIYNLLRTEDVTSAVFICPATGQRSEDYGGGLHTALDRCNFSSGATLSYSYANPYPNAAATKAGYKMRQGLDPTFAVAADMNPGTPALLQLSVTSTAAQMRAGNSSNHSGDGQNVLFGDGHVEFDNNPFVGTNRDNIYTYGPSGVDATTQAALPTGGTGIWGSPIGPADSILLPAAVLPTMATAAPAPTDASADSTPTPPPAQIDQGMDLTTILVISSLIFLIVLLAALTAVILRSKRSRQAGRSQ